MGGSKGGSPQSPVPPCGYMILLTPLFAQDVQRQRRPGVRRSGVGAWVTWFSELTVSHRRGAFLIAALLTELVVTREDREKYVKIAVPAITGQAKSSAGTRVASTYKRRSNHGLTPSASFAAHGEPEVLPADCGSELDGGAAPIVGRAAENVRRKRISSRWATASAPHPSP